MKEEKDEWNEGKDEWKEPFPKKFNKTIPINKEGPFGFATGYIPAIKVKKKKK